MAPNKVVFERLLTLSEKRAELDARHAAIVARLMTSQVSSDRSATEQLISRMNEAIKGNKRAVERLDEITEEYLNPTRAIAY
jgi:hypothetical protein